jgi:hypothetical protein
VYTYASSSHYTSLGRVGQQQQETNNSNNDDHQHILKENKDNNCSSAVDNSSSGGEVNTSNSNSNHLVLNGNGKQNYSNGERSSEAPQLSARLGDGKNNIPAAVVIQQSSVPCSSLQQDRPIIYQPSSSTMVSPPPPLRGGMPLRQNTVMNHHPQQQRSGTAAAATPSVIVVEHIQSIKPSPSPPPQPAHHQQLSPPSSHHQSITKNGADEQHQQQQQHLVNKPSLSSDGDSRVGQHRTLSLPLPSTVEQTSPPADLQPINYSSEKPKSYQPYTVEDFRKINHPVKVGSLGYADTDDKKQGRDARAKMREYSRTVRDVNASGPPEEPKPILPAPDPGKEKAKEKRMKALEFAAKVPKPKVVIRSSCATLMMEQNHNCTHNVPSKHTNDEISIREQQHEVDCEFIRALKKDLQF